MYPQELTKPMIEELTKNGFSELKTTESVTNNLGDNSGKCLVLINSVCGCAAGAARPGVRQALDERRATISGQNSQMLHNLSPELPSGMNPPLGGSPF